MSNVKKVKEQYEEELLDLPNVIGVETGFKEVDGIERGERSIRVLVRKKASEEELEEKHIIPKKIDGIKTDVEDQNGEIEPMKDRMSKWRPCPMGVSIGHEDITAGTQGTIVKRNNEFYCLSNAHVKANVNKGEKGDIIIQQGSHDGGTVEDNKLEKLYDSIRINSVSNSDCKLSRFLAWFFNGISSLLNRRTRFKLKTEVKPNEVDAAIGRALDQDKIAYHVLGPEDKRRDTGYKKLYHRGSRKAKVGEKVWVSGRTLGYKGKGTAAKVKSTDATIRVRYPNGMATFKNQIHIKSDRRFSKGGMSGSAVVATTDDKAIGLLFSGNRDGTSTFLNRIGVVEEKLGCEVIDMQKEKEK